MTRAAVLFPGQGNLAADLSTRLERTDPELHALIVGRAGDDVFERADEGQRWRQPALFAASMGCWRTIERAIDAGDLAGTEPEVIAFAGHSLGEIAALVAAGSLAVADAVEYVCLRGELFHDVEQNGPPAAMLTIIGDGALDFARTQAEIGVSVANDNSPQQVVLAGPKDAVLAARAAARESGLRAVTLPMRVGGHTPMVGEVVAPLAELLSGFEFAPPALPVWSSTLAAPFGDPRQELAAGCALAVRWRETVIGLRDAGAELMIDVGPGHVLAAQAAKTVGPDVEVLAPCDE